MRFYKPTIKQPISTFVEAPIEFIQGQMNVEQKRIDDASKAIADANKEYLGVQSGLYSKDLFKEFKNKYQNKFSDLSEQLIMDPSKAGLISHEIAKLNSSYKSDPLYNEITKDFMNYTKAMDKLAGSDKPYYFNRTGQLKINPDGTVESSSPSDYMALTDKGAYNTLYEQVAKLKPEVYKENGKKYVSLLNPDGTYSQQEIKTEKDVEVLRLERINKYLEDAFVTTNTDGSFEYHYRDAAEKAGDPALAKNPEFRRKVYNQIVEPIKQQAYQKVQTAEIITNLNQSVNNSSRGSLGTNPQEYIQPKIISGKTQARNAAPISSTGNIFVTPSDILTDVNNIQKQENAAAATIAKITENVLGKKLVTVSDWQNLYSKFKTVDGKLVPSNSGDREAIDLLNSYGFQEAYGLRETLNQNKKNTQVFYDKITEGQDFDSNVLKEAEKKYIPELAHKYHITPPSDFSSSKEQIEEYKNITTIQQLKEYVKKYKVNQGTIYNDITQEFINNNDDSKNQSELKRFIPKDSKEYKIYERLESYQQRMEDVELRVLPSSSKEAQDLKSFVINLLEGDKAGSFKDMVTDKTVDIKNLIEKIPKDSNGKTDLSTVDIGYFADPDEGMKSFIMINGEKYEFNMSDTSMQSIVQALDPTESTRFNVYNQAIKTITASQGQEGKITFPGGIEFNFKEVQDKNNSKDFKYEYIDQYGVTRKVNSIKDMMNDLYSFYTETGIASSKELRNLYTGLLEQLNNKKIDPIIFNQKMSEAINAEKLRMQNSPMGKSQEWVQTPKKPLQ